MLNDRAHKNLNALKGDPNTAAALDQSAAPATTTITAVNGAGFTLDPIDDVDSNNNSTGYATVQSLKPVKYNTDAPGATGDFVKPIHISYTLADLGPNSDIKSVEGIQAEYTKKGLSIEGDADEAYDEQLERQALKEKEPKSANDTANEPDPDNDNSPHFLMGSDEEIAAALAAGAAAGGGLSVLRLLAARKLVKEGEHKREEEKVREAEEARKAEKAEKEAREAEKAAKAEKDAARGENAAKDVAKGEDALKAASTVSKEEKAVAEARDLRRGITAAKDISHASHALKVGGIPALIVQELAVPVALGVAYYELAPEKQAQDQKLRDATNIAYKAEVPHDMRTSIANSDYWGAFVQFGGHVKNVAYDTAVDVKKLGDWMERYDADPVAAKQEAIKYAYDTAYTLRDAVQFATNNHELARKGIEAVVDGTDVVSNVQANGEAGYPSTIGPQADAAPTPSSNDSRKRKTELDNHNHVVVALSGPAPQ